jgi:menaquinone-dependent protoporphyrinogen IX oxidase
MAGIIVYDSKYGHTRDIAHFLAHELEMPIHQLDTINHVLLSDYDPIIFATPVYVEHIAMAKALNEMVPYLMDKTMYCLVVGAHEKDKAYFANLLDQNIEPEVQRHIHFYQIAGAITVDQLRSAHKFLIWFMDRFNDEKMDVKFASDVKETSSQPHNLIELNDQALVQIMNNIRAHQAKMAAPLSPEA